jgi:methylated-DNA-[protein]-cysteine S-methyltransferase
MLAWSSLKTPVGKFHFIARDQILIAAGFQDLDRLRSRLTPGDLELPLRRSSAIPVVSELLSNYFLGDLYALSGIKVWQPGEKFSQATWKAMRTVAAGKTISYSELARKAGSSGATRAAGSACARNLITVVIPCHRVINSSGSLGQYASGILVKEWLLRHEGFLK